MPVNSQDVVDIHPHVISADQQRYPFNPVGGELSAWVKNRPVNVKELIEAMDRVNIAQAVLVQASTAYGYDNSYVIDCAAEYPERLQAIGCVNPLSPAAAQDIKYWVTERGVVGLRLFAAGSTIKSDSDWLDSPETYPAWEEAERQGVPLCIQTKFSTLPRLVPMLQRFSGVKVVLDHIAYPDLTEGPEHIAANPLLGLSALPNVFLKLTMRNLEPLTQAQGGPGQFLNRLVSAFGADRIAWGSNYPAAASGLDQLLQLALESLVSLTDTQRNQIMAGTARRLYPALNQLPKTQLARAETQND